MCDRKRACAEADRARRLVGEWLIRIGPKRAADLQFVRDEMKRAGLRPGDAGDVLLWCLTRTANELAGRAAFTLTGEDDQ